MSDVVTVGLAELKVTDNSHVLASFGLGSCVAVAIFDPVRKKGGLAHVMLPESKCRDSELAPGKFADTAVARLVDELVLAGARPRSLLCKLVGGSEMFRALGSFSGAQPAGAAAPPIGARNIQAVKRALDQLGVPVVAEDTGGHHGRTVRFDVSTGEVEVSSINHGKNVI